MKNITLLNLLIAVIVSTCMLSCKKYLDKKSDTSLVSPVTVADMQGMLDDFYTMNSQTPSFGEASADDYFILPATYNGLPVIDQKAYGWKVDVYNFPNDWAYCYNPVYNANYCLDQLEHASRTEQNKNAWDNVKGSALFYRAFNFLNLAWVFAKTYDETNSQNDPGIALRLTSDFNQPSQRASVKETYRQIVSDLNASIGYLPATPLHPARPSKAAAYALLARTWLSMRNYDSAFKYADLSLQLKSNLLDYNNPDLINPASTAPFKPFNPEIIFFTTMANSFSVKNPGTALIDSVLYASYNDNDVRKIIFFRTSGMYRRFKGTYASASVILFTGLAVDEVYLVRAECRARAGNVSEAMDDLNMLLEKRWVTGTFLPYTAATQSEALKIILLERRKQLLMRGIRWSDIKRLNADGANIIQKRMIGTEQWALEPNESRYALPLPQDIIDQTGMKQN